MHGENRIKYKKIISGKGRVSTLTLAVECRDQSALNF
jgi:hypothetical protein